MGEQYSGTQHENQILRTWREGKSEWMQQQAPLTEEFYSRIGF